MQIRFSVLPSTFRPVRFLLVLAFVWLTQTVTVAQSQTPVTSTWIGDDNGQWYNANNWDTGITPNNLQTDVVINGDVDSAASVILSQGGLTTIRNLSLGAGDSLRLESGPFSNQALTVEGSVTTNEPASLSNQGVISVITNDFTGSAFSSRGELRLADTTILTGGGRIELSDGALQFSNSFTADTEVINVDNQIQGFGEIDLALVDKFTNSTNGLIAASQSGTRLVIVDNSSRFLAEFTNEGTLRAVDGGLLSLDIDVVNSGTIEALDGSIVAFEDGASVVGGTLSTTGSGTLELSVVDSSQSAQVLFNDVTLDGNVVVQQGAILDLQGTIDNRQSILAQGSFDFFNRPDVITANGAVTLTGGGSIDLVDAAFGDFGPDFFAQGPPSVTNVDNTIQGSGDVTGDFINEADGFVIANRVDEVLSVGGTNRGTFLAENGGLLVVGSLNNSDGVIESLDNSSVAVVGNVTGGTLRNVGSGKVTVDGQVSDLTLEGSISTFGGAMLAGNIVNEGRLEVGPGIQFGSALAINDSVTLSGGGTVVLASTDSDQAGISDSDTSNVFNSDLTSRAPDVLTNVDNMISGNGFIGSERLQVINDTNGTIEAVGSLRLSSSGTDPFVNRGALRAGQDSTLFLGGSEFSAPTGNQINNQGGLIEATAGGQVDLTGAEITGGTVRTVDNGVLTVRGFSFANNEEDIARISDATVGGNIQFGVNNEFFQEPGGQIQFERIDITGQELNFTRASRDLSSFATISFVGDTSLEGGTVRLQSEEIFISDSVGEVGDFSNFNSTIEGFGFVGYRRQDFVNESGGVINANVDQRELTFTTGTSDNEVTNRGVLRASNGGELVISGNAFDFNSGTFPGTLDNTGGRIEALAGSTVSVRNSAFVVGGEIVGVEDSRLVLGRDRSSTFNQGFGSLRDVTLDIAAEIAEQGDFGFAGQIVNRQSIDVSESSTLVIEGDTTFSGGGTIQLNGSVNFSGSIDTDSTQPVTLTNTDHTIQGFGSIGSFNSQSVMNIVNEAGGVIQANMENETLDIGGDFVSPPTFVNRGLLLASNGGTLSFLPEVVNEGIIEAEEASTIAGFIDNGINGTVRGDGTIGGFFAVLDNDGTIAPGVSSAGSLTLDSTVVLNDTSVLEIDLFGTEAGDFDVLEVTGALDLGGLLSVNLEGFIPTLEDEFRVITALNFDGSFDAFSLGEFQTTIDGQYEFLVSIDDDPGAAPSLLLSNFRTTAVPEPSSAVVIGIALLAGMGRRRRSVT